MTTGAQGKFGSQSTRGGRTEVEKREIEKADNLWPNERCEVDSESLWSMW